MAVIDDTVARQVTCHGFRGGDPVDHESYKNFFRTFRKSFADLDWKLHALIADENYVSARWQIWATHSDDFAGVKADGRRITCDRMVLYRLEDGLIVETWLQVDHLGLLGVIGAWPALAA